MKRDLLKFRYRVHQVNATGLLHPVLVYMRKHYTFKDLAGKNFGKLTVIKRVSQPENLKKRGVYWECLCSCDNKICYKTTANLITGHAISCGCRRTEQIKELTTGNIKYPPNTQQTGEYRSWNGMLVRCNPLANHKAKKHYADRGITVCDRWKGRNGFLNFLHDMGKKPTPKHSIDRIDNNKGYSKENCRWATQFEQLHNTRRNHWVEYNSKRMIVADWGRELGIDARRISENIIKGKTMQFIVEKYSG